MEGLKEPFEACDIEWRAQQSGKSSSGKSWAMVLAYITNRAIQERLDDVCGPLGWKNEFSEGPGGGVVCGISIYDKEKSQWVTKYDGADNTDIESVKGGLSSSMKRAGAQWGIGRYLYNLEASFAECSDKKSGLHKHYDKKNRFYWKEPDLPRLALPKPVLDRNSSNWDAACKSIKERLVTPEQAASKYIVSKEDFDYLSEIYNKMG
jgi:hypothetical protein